MTEKWWTCECGTKLQLVWFGAAEAATNYTVHEWGTFTSVQGGNGQLLLWLPLKTAELPGFVYDWNNAGLNRRKLVASKTSVMTLQRMETPVMYFYADQSMNVNVNVALETGDITQTVTDVDSDC